MALDVEPRRSAILSPQDQVVAAFAHFVCQHYILAALRVAQAGDGDRVAPRDGEIVFFEEGLGAESDLRLACAGLQPYRLADLAFALDHAFDRSCEDFSTKRLSAFEFLA
jgi:hypothetical protein